MIVTLTANPSFDRTIALSGHLERGGVLRADAVLEQAGGKGVNISRAALAASEDTIAVFPAAGDSPFTVELQQAGLTCRPVAPTGAIRVNLTLSEADGTTTKINSAGAVADAALLARLRAPVTDLAGSAPWVVLAGSLPPGAPDDWYAEVAAALTTTGAKVAVDTSDRPLIALADALGTARPDLMKPNAEELAQLTGDDPAAVEADPAVAARPRGGSSTRDGRRPRHPGRGGRRPGHRRGRLACHSPADHRRQHGRRRGLQPVRLRPRRPPQRRARREAPPRGGLRKRRGVPAGHHDSRASPGAAGPRRGPPDQSGGPDPAPETELSATREQR